MAAVSPPLLPARDLDGQPWEQDGDEDGAATLDMGAFELCRGRCSAFADGFESGDLGAWDLAIPAL